MDDGLQCGVYDDGVPVFFFVVLQSARGRD
jgi:hypothetical protein